MASVGPAASVAIADLSRGLVGRKVRLAGFCVKYDAVSAELVLLHERAHITIDISLFLEDTLAVPIQYKSKLMCIGTLELSAPSGPDSARRGDAVPQGALVLRALFLKVVDDLDLRVWVQAARALQGSETREEGIGVPDAPGPQNTQPHEVDSADAHVPASSTRLYPVSAYTLR
ncbi:hypothetical protein MSPP1_003585 [Malassezia sp. CBS 17886]|nr:hypothetical protein MSPP1_003585 [Malassezia sp. CBS 17886]